jgi:hypothetical protein
MKVIEHRYTVIEVECDDTVRDLFDEVGKYPAGASVIAYEGSLEIHYND